MQQPLEEFVRASLAERYTAPVVRADGGIVRLLAGRPLDLARERARAAGYDDVDVRIAELDVTTLPWHVVPGTGVRLWRQHGLAGDDGELVTDAEAGDPALQVVAEHEGWQLARLLDGATGWAEPGTIDTSVGVDAPTVTPAGGIDPSRLAEAATGFLGVPYRWGGTTRAGVDCSGLVQRSGWLAGGHWLPRHSRALLRVGARGSQRSLARGDVLVLQRRPESKRDADDGFHAAHSGPDSHSMHVAIALDATTVIHASRDAWMVVQEPCESLHSRYRVLSVRQFGAGD